MLFLIVLKKYKAAHQNTLSPPDDRVTTDQASAGSPPGLQCQCHGDISIRHSTAMKTLVLGDT